MENSKQNDGSVFTVALLVAGMTVGAGTLGLPVTAGLTGMVPSFVGLLIVWAFMLGTGIILSESFIRYGQNNADLAELFRADLGKPGKWVASIAYLGNYYGILIAYLAAAGQTLNSLFHLNRYMGIWTPLVMFVPATLLCMFGLRLIRKCNVALMTLLFISFAALLYLTAEHVKLAHLQRTDWGFLPMTFPILVCAFAYQCVVPNVCRQLGNDRKRIVKALALGTAIPFVINLAWIAAVAGSLPLNHGIGNLVQAHANNVPATVPLSQALHSKMIVTVGLSFTLCAILTSYIAVGSSLQGFIRDIGSSIPGMKGRWLPAAATFTLPLIIVLVYPKIFLTMLNLVGGAALTLVFGILPAMIFLKKGSLVLPFKKVLAVMAILFFLGVMALEICQEAGVLNINPDAEYLPHVSKTASGK